MAHEITGIESFKERLSDANRLLVVYFTATWCAPCKRISPLFDQLPKKFPSVNFSKVVESRCEELVNKLKIEAFPTFRFYLSAKKVGEVEGADFSAVQRKVEALRPQEEEDECSENTSSSESENDGDAGEETLDRNTTDLYVMNDTLECALSNCIVCCYKIVLGPGTQDACIPNKRPEECHRLQKAGKAGTDTTRGKKLTQGLYQRGDHILTVGDGDLSFSLALARAFLQVNRKGKNKKSEGSSDEVPPGIKLVATTHEPLDTLLQTYPAVRPTLRELEARGVEVLHGVDATRLGAVAALRGRRFHRAVWNFPCRGRGLAPGSDGQNQEMESNKQLVREFCKSAEDFLVPWGEVHMTHKTKPPFCHWGIERLGSDLSQLQFKGSVVFDRSCYQPYTNRKALHKKSFPITDAEIFIFSKPSLLCTGNDGGGSENSSLESTTQHYPQLGAPPEGRKDPQAPSMLRQAQPGDNGWGRIKRAGSRQEAEEGAASEDEDGDGGGEEPRPPPAAPSSPLRHRAGRLRAVTPALLDRLRRRLVALNPDAAAAARAAA
eukprot:CAMPEP_0206365946 /NCGR_PEP_ID=MMETSP0294-20121207/3169_1 /ASSEMBLY_ACC=CAM_ASM_000327 /TAXON_ID=39354 /ORGANISM="Heterosigma akashiwo, Strain CCMP2393" /LENGTH=549 /DNA_ID=CAMNT_0053811937 /DNA_START=15 /DNA_END=1662 /DNA_ORIENTATION=+